MHSISIYVQISETRNPILSKQGLQSLPEFPGGQLVWTEKQTLSCFGRSFCPYGCGPCEGPLSPWDCPVLSLLETVRIQKKVYFKKLVSFLFLTESFKERHSRYGSHSGMLVSLQQMKHFKIRLTILSESCLTEFFTGSLVFSLLPYPTYTNPKMHTHLRTNTVLFCLNSCNV